MTYLLDTNACIALINGTPKEVRRRFRRAVNKDATMLVSSVVAFELWLLQNGRAYYEADLTGIFIKHNFRCILPEPFSR